MKKIIKANYAKIEGDYVIVERTSFRIERAFLCFVGVGSLSIIVFSILTLLFIKSNPNLIFILSISFWVSFFVAITSLFLPKKREIYEIPRKDLILIKRYPIFHRVTVIIDDEKNKLEFFK